MITIRFALYLTLMLLFGLPLFRLHALSSAERKLAQIPRFAVVVPVLASLGLALSALWFLFLTAEMADASIAGLDHDTITAVMASPVGTAWLVRMAALLGALTLVLAFRRTDGALGPVLVSLSAATALTTLPWAGHGAAGEGRAGTIQLIADTVHLLAAGIWIGALAAFVILLFQRTLASSAITLGLAANALRRFSTTGAVAVALIVLSGLINSYMLVGVSQATRLLDTLYGQILLAKLGLFLLMLALAATNRFRLTPSLSTAIAGGDANAALRALRISVAIEATAGLCVLGLVAWLGTLEPPITAGAVL